MAPANGVTDGGTFIALQQSRSTYPRGSAMPTKLDLLLLAAAIAAAVVWIEHEHRVVIDPPDQPELALPVLASRVPACSDSDSQGDDRLVFLEGGFTSRIRNRQAERAAW